MRRILFYCLTVILFAGCGKEHGSKVEIYTLKSFTVTPNQDPNLGSLTISNAVLDDIPFVRDEDIAFYTQSATTFRLKKNIKPIIQDYDGNKAFAVTVDGEPVYLGFFHPAYLSSLIFGVATIDPLLFFNNDLQIQFILLNESAAMKQLDKRNSSRIVNTLRASGRIR